MKRLLLLSLLVLLGCSKDDKDFFDRVNGKIFITTQTVSAVIKKEEALGATKISERFVDNEISQFTGLFSKFISASGTGSCYVNYGFRTEQYENEWEYTDITSDYVRLEMGIPTRVIVEARITRTNPMIISFSSNNSPRTWMEISLDEYQTMLDRWDCSSDIPARVFGK